MHPIFEITFPQEHECFNGHFDNNPIVPGAYLLSCAQFALHGQDRHVTEITQSKFLSPIVPGDTLRFFVSKSGGNTKLRVEWKKGNESAGFAIFRNIPPL